MLLNYGGGGGFSGDDDAGGLLLCGGVTGDGLDFWLLLWLQRLAEKFAACRGQSVAAGLVRRNAGYGFRNIFLLKKIVKKNQNWHSHITQYYSKKIEISSVEKKLDAYAEKHEKHAQ